MKKHISIGYIDILTCLFALFLAFFVLSETAKSTGNVDDPSLFLITLEWSKDSRADVDLFAKGPDGNVVNFLDQESTVMSLDTDDKGLKPVDVVRREVISVKKIMPGRFVVNGLMYKGKGEAVSVKVSVVKLRGFSVVCEAEFVLGVDGEEKTVCSFDVDMAGNVIYVDSQMQRSLVKGN